MKKFFIEKIPNTLGVLIDPSNWAGESVEVHIADLCESGAYAGSDGASWYDGKTAIKGILRESYGCVSITLLHEVEGETIERWCFDVNFYECLGKLKVPNRTFLEALPVEFPYSNPTGNPRHKQWLDWKLPVAHQEGNTIVFQAEDKWGNPLYLKVEKMTDENSVNSFKLEGLTKWGFLKEFPVENVT